MNFNLKSFLKFFFLLGVLVATPQMRGLGQLQAQDLKDELDALEDPPEEDLSQFDNPKPENNTDETLPPEEDMELPEEETETPPPVATQVEPPPAEPQPVEPEETLELDEDIAEEPPAPAAPVEPVEEVAPTEAAETAPAPEPETDETETATAEALTGVEDELTAKINSIQFRQLKDRVRLTVTADRALDYNQSARIERRQVILEFKNAKFSKSSLNRVFDTGEFDGPLALVQPFESKIGVLPSIKILFQLREKSDPRITRSGNQVFVDFLIKGQAGRKIFKDDSAENAPEFPETFLSVDGKARYRGTRISLNLKEASLREVIAMLSNVAGRNFVITGATDAKVTLNVKDVPWDQVLAIILVNNQLGYQKVGSIYRIMPVTQIKTEMDAIVRAQEDKVNLVPLETRLIPISYARAAELSANVTGLLSRRGRASIDARTNSLVVTDTGETLDKIMAYIQSVDKQTALVEIQARIVEAQEEFGRNLALNWDLGPLTAGRFANSTINTGASNLSNPTSRLTSDGGNARLRIGLGGSLNTIEALLGLAEQKNQARVIASPKVTVLDNRSATISRGDQITIPVPGGNGAPGTTATISANLSLSVTPQVTSDGYVLMNVSVSRNIPAAGNPQSQTTRSVNTEMLVESGKTGVLGGIYVLDKSQNERGWPWFQRLPIFGALFRANSTMIENSNELLVFISPRILNADKTFLSYKDTPSENGGFEGSGPQMSVAPGANSTDSGLGGAELDDDLL